MSKLTPIMRLVIVIVIGTIGGEFLSQYEHYRRFGYWKLYEPSENIPDAIGMIFVVAVLIYLVKKNTKGK